MLSPQVNKSSDCQKIRITELHLADCTPTTFEIILELFQKFKGTFYNSVGLAQRSQDIEYLRMIIANESIGQLFMAWQDDVAVGYAALVYKLESGTSRHVCFLNDLYVESEVRNQGIAHALMDYCIKYLSDRGSTYLQWFTHEYNVPARRLYKDYASEISTILYFRKISPSNLSKPPAISVNLSIQSTDQLDCSENTNQAKFNTIDIEFL